MTNIEKVLERSFGRNVFREKILIDKLYETLKCD